MFLFIYQVISLLFFPLRLFLCVFVLLKVNFAFSIFNLHI